MADRLDLSVVVIPLVGNDVLANCLDRLPLDAIECIVVPREPVHADSSWLQRYPSIIFLDATGTSVPVRRKRGVAASTRAIVGIIEDTSWPSAHWCQAIQSAFVDTKTAAVGGPVEISNTLPTRYQALGWSEYGAFASGRYTTTDNIAAVSRVPGNNMAFRRAALPEATDDACIGMIEGPTCAKLRDKGYQVVLHPRMLVTYAACDERNALLAARCNHGRLYASSHVADFSRLLRVAHAMKAILLPFVLTSRAVSSVIRSGHGGVSVIFWIALMECAWAIGEATGALAGAGKSLDEWR